MISELNTVVGNFYNSFELDILKTYVEEEVKASSKLYRQEELGRFYASVFDKYGGESVGGFPERLLEKTRTFAQDHFQIAKLELFDIVFISYSTKTGLEPKLTRHKDNGSVTKYTVDYQYASNIDWPITVEDKEYTLKDNEVLTFLGSDQYHGRPDKIFKDDEIVENIFFQFIEKRK